MAPRLTKRGGQINGTRDMTQPRSLATAAMPNANSRPAHSCYRCNHAPLAKRTTLVRSKGCLSNKTSLAMIFKVAEAAEKSWRRLDGQNQSPKVILSDRKLKLPPPDPFRHQDSAIALRRGPSGAIGEVAMTLDLGNARSAVKPGTLKTHNIISLSCGGAQHAYHGHL
jgi:hypothetical protein